MKQRSPIQLYIPVCMFLIVLLFLGVYIYFINQAIVDTLAIERFEHERVTTEEEIHNLEARLASLAVGTNLKEEAILLGLEDRGPIHFIARDIYFAQAENTLR